MANTLAPHEPKAAIFPMPLCADANHTAVYTVERHSH